MINALDACERAGVAPEITLRVSPCEIAITDTGPDIPPEVVKRILDYATRTSDKLAYVSPTRGAQGNAWKTLLAIPYVLDGELALPVVVEESNGEKPSAVHGPARVRALNERHGEYR